MAARGDVLRVRRRVGFSGEGTDDRVVVLQATRANDVLPSVIVAPIDLLASIRPFWVPISPTESGLDAPACIVLPALGAVAANRLDPTLLGRVAPGTLAALDLALGVLLGLR